MADFNFDKPIKVTYIFEDDDSNETDIVQNTSENSQVSEIPTQDAYPLNKSNINSTTEVMQDTLSSNICNSNVTCYRENGPNIEREKRVHTKENYNRRQNQLTSNSNAISNPNAYLREIENVNSITSNHNYSASNVNTQDLLDSLSENLIMVTRYYHYYNSVHVKINNARWCFFKNKHYYYHQSYNVIIAAFLPQEHNYVFIRNFINRTIEIANRKWRYNLLTSTLENILNNIILWAKLKKEARFEEAQNVLCTAPGPSNLSPCSVPYNNPLQPANIPAPVSLVPSVPLFTSAPYSISNRSEQPVSRPPVSLIPSDIQEQPPSYSICNINTRHEIEIPPPISIPPYLPPSSNSLSNVNITTTIQQPNNRLPPTAPVTSGTIPSLSVTPVPPKSRASFCGQSNFDLGQLITGASVSTLPAPSASDLITNTKSYSNERISADHDSSICLFSNGPIGSEISITIDSAIAKILNDKNIDNSKNKDRNTLHKGIRKTRKKRCDTERTTILSKNTWIPPSRHQNYPSCNSINQPSITSNAESVNTRMQPINNSNQSRSREKQNHQQYDECPAPSLSRSESRDSGFGSPVLSAILTANDYQTIYPQCTDNQECTPEIRVSHVTSMNPDAIFNTSGTCKMCGTTTKNKCIVCYKEYYCGTTCQTVDWPLHMQTCKAS